MAIKPVIFMFLLIFSPAFSVDHFPPHPREVLQSAPDGIKWTDRATVAGASGFISTELAEPVLTQWLRVPRRQLTMGL